MGRDAPGMTAYSPQPERSVDSLLFARQLAAADGATLCVGCHSVSYKIQTQTVTECNVGCEKGHGPGAAHAQGPSGANIVTRSVGLVRRH